MALPGQLRLLCRYKRTKMIENGTFSSPAAPGELLSPPPVLVSECRWQRGSCSRALLLGTRCS